MERVDRRDELELGIGGDGRAHRRPHPAAGAEHTDPDHDRRSAWPQGTESPDFGPDAAAASRTEGAASSTGPTTARLRSSATTTRSTTRAMSSAWTGRPRRRARRARAPRRASARCGRGGACVRSSSRATARASPGDDPSPTSSSRSLMPASVDEPRELGVDDAQQLVEPLGCRAGRDRERAGLLERGAVRVDRVRETAPLADLLEEPRRHPATERLVQHRERVAIGIVGAQRAHPERPRAPARCRARGRRPVAAPASPGHGSRAGRAPSAWVSPCSTSATTSSWSTFPAAATTTLLGW